MILLGTHVVQRLIVGAVVLEIPLAPPHVPTTGVSAGGGQETFTLATLPPAPPAKVPASTQR